jgi:glycosyltransferase involved in cell wall biosynthesis
LRNQYKFEISVVIPISNMAGRLDDLQQCIRDSTNLGFQIILIHDESDDLTDAEIKTMIKEINSENITYKKIKVSSVGLARNFGIGLATGDWIVFWDSDDIPIPTQYLEMARMANLEKLDVVIGDFAIEELINKRQVQQVRTRESIHGMCLNPGLWRFLFKRSILQNHEFPAYNMGEDQVFIARLRIDFASFGFYPEVVYKYRKGFTNQLTNSVSKKREVFFALVDCYKLVLDEPSSLVTRLLFINQFLATMKYARIIHKFRSILMILKLFLRFPKKVNEVLIVHTGLRIRKYFDEKR